MLLDDGLEREQIQQQVTAQLSLAKLLDVAVLSAQLDPESELGKQVTEAQEQHAASGSTEEFRCTLQQAVSSFVLQHCNVFWKLQCSLNHQNKNTINF